MASNIEVLTELDRRGALPENKRAIFEELKRRGVVAGAQPAPFAPIPDPVRPPTSQAGLLDAASNAGRSLDDIVRSLASGATLGFADKVAGAANTALSGGDLNENILAEQARSDEIPLGVSIPGNIAGGLATAGLAPALAVGRGVASFPLAGRIASYLGLGAGTGAIAGAGTAAPGEELQGALQGGAAGAILGPLGAGAAKGIGAVASKLREKMTTGGVSAAAAARILKAMQRDELTPEAALAELDRLGPGAVLADAGPNVSGLAEVVANRPGPGLKALSDALETRDAGQLGRITDIVDAATPPSRALVPTGRDFEAALDIPVPLTRKLKTLMQRPAMQKAYTAAQRLAREQDQALPSLDEIMADDFVGVQTRVLHWLKKGLDDVLEPKRDAITGVVSQNFGKNELEAIKKTRFAFRDELKNLNQVYGGQLNELSKQFGVNDAFTEGANFVKRKTARDINQIVGRLSPDELAAYRRGVAQSIDDTISGPGGVGFDVTRRLLTQQEKLRAAFGDSAENIINRLKGEREIRQNSQRITGNSRTGFRAEAAADFDAPAGLANIATDAAMGNKVGLLRQVLREGTERLTRPSDKVSGEIGQALSQGGIRSKILLDALEKAAKAAEARKSVLGTGVAGAGGALGGTLF